MSTAWRNRRKGSQWPWYRGTGKRAAGRGGAKNPVGRAEAAVQKSAIFPAQCDCTGKLARAYPAPQCGESNGRMSGKWEDTGKSAGGRLGAAAQENRQEEGLGMEAGGTDGRALESGGAGKPAERCPGGVAQKNRQAGMRAAAREDRGRRTGRGGTEKATGTPPRGGWHGNPREQAARKRDRPKRPDCKESGQLPRSATARSSLSISPVLMALRRSPPAGRR